MSLKLLTRRLSRVSAQRLAAQPAAKQKEVPPEKEDFKLSTLPNGLTVASVENLTPVIRIAAILKAGSRFEKYNNLGVTHALRYCAGLGTETATCFGITRNLQQMGATLRATSTRDHFIYTLECNRDEIDNGLGFMAQVVAEQVFKPWEVSDYQYRLKIERELARNQPELILMEQLHRAAYHSSLQNSLYAPKHMIGAHDSEMLTAFVKDHFTAKRMALVAVGMPHEVLTEYSELFDLEGGAGPDKQPPNYVGGEVRLPLKDNLAYVAVVAEGVSLQNPKDVLAAAVLQQVMGVGPYVAYGNPSTKLAVAAGKASKNAFAVSSININYTDTGLFGFYIVGLPEDMESLVKAVVSQYNSTAKSGVADLDFQGAKKRVKSAVLMGLESNNDLLYDMGVQAVETGKYINAQEVGKLIDSVNLSDVNSIAKKVAGGKPAMASVGNLSHTPYLEQLR